MDRNFRSQSLPLINSKDEDSSSSGFSTEDSSSSSSSDNSYSHGSPQYYPVVLGEDFNPNQNPVAGVRTNGTDQRKTNRISCTQVLSVLFLLCIFSYTSLK